MAGRGDTGAGFDLEVAQAEREGYDVFTGEPTGTNVSGIDEEAERQRNFDASQADIQRRWEEQQEEARRQIDRQNIIALLTNTFNEYGLGSLIPKIIGYAQQNYNSDAIAALLRETPEYQARFPAMKALAQKGRAISEGAYIAYERTASGLERQYGLPQGMLMNNITQMLTNEVSIEELNERVLLASSASVYAPEALKESFRNFYGVDALTSYFLDPTIATPLLQKQYATAQIGAEASRQNVNLQLQTAAQLQELGISQEQARSGFQQVRRFEGLSAGRGDTVDQSRMIQGVFGDQEAGKDIERAQASRLGRFQGGGGFVAEREGVSGLAPTRR